MTEKLATDSGAERAARRIAELLMHDSNRNFRLNDQGITAVAAIIREETGTPQRCPTCDSDNPTNRTGYFKYRSCFDPWHFDPRGITSHNQPLPAVPDEGGKR